MTNFLSINSIRGLSVFALLFAVIAMPVQAQQTGFTRPVIAVLNPELIERDSLAAKGIRLERDKFLTRYQSEVRELETEFREEGERLEQQRARNMISPEVWEQSAAEFQQRLATAQQEVQIKQQNLNVVYQQAIVQVQQEMMRITGQVAQELGANMVLQQGLTLMSDPSMDITGPVLEILNERLPSVQMQNPEVDNAADSSAGSE